MLSMKGFQAFLLENEFSKGRIDNTLFIKNKGDDFLLFQIYVDGIIFGANFSAIIF